MIHRRGPNFEDAGIIGRHSLACFSLQFTMLTSLLRACATRRGKEVWLVPAPRWPNPSCQTPHGKHPSLPDPASLTTNHDRFSHIHALDPQFLHPQSCSILLPSPLLLEVTRCTRLRQEHSSQHADQVWQYPSSLLVRRDADVTIEYELSPVRRSSSTSNLTTKYATFHRRYTFLELLECAHMVVKHCKPGHILTVSRSPG
jgi:hypothetical protein